MGRIRFNPNTDVIRLYAIVEGLEEKTRMLRMIFDPGSTYVVLRTSVAQTLNLTRGPSLESVRIVSAHRVQNVPRVSATSITALGHNLKNIDVIYLDLPPQLGTDGLLGNSFLRNFKIIVDYPEGILEFIST